MPDGLVYLSSDVLSIISPENKYPEALWPKKLQSRDPLTLPNGYSRGILRAMTDRDEEMGVVKPAMELL